METISFDFDKIGTEKDFYTTAARQLKLPEHFGSNLDALWDVVTGHISLPVKIDFINLTMSQLETFSDVIAMFEDAAGALGESFVFNYSLKRL